MKAFIIGIIAVVIIGAGYLALNNKDTTEDTSSTTTSATQTESKTPASSDQTAAATITYSGSGFSPAKVTVKSGDTIAIKNDSGNELDFESDPHPVHTGNDELNIGSVGKGQTVTFKVTKKGTHGYHNHLNSADTGSVEVQ